MSDSLVSGAAAVVDWVALALQTYWQGALTAICADMGIATLTAPNAANGYSKSRILPRDTSPGCQLFVVRTSWDVERIVIVGAARRMLTTISFRVRWAPKEATDAEHQVQAYVAAARQVLAQYWRTGWGTGTHKNRCVDFRIDTDESGESLRQRGQAEGLDPWGEGYPATDEVGGLIIEADHFVNNPISFS